jgi:methylthioribose-1-phosphate isomerase
VEKKERNVLPDHVGLNAAGDRVRILDQSQLPNRQVYLELGEVEELVEAIVSLRVRGAPAIGIFAGYAMYVLALQLQEGGTDAFLLRLEALGETLNHARPTAVNLSWAIRRMMETAREHQDLPRNKLLERLQQESVAIHTEDAEMCQAIARYGLTLVRDGDGVLTHCNAGEIATSRYGTALGPILLGKEQGVELKVFADETRPLLQGARLTAWELQRAGVDVTLICDNMASMVMKNGWVQACFVGCDRVAANGDTANKIGTSGVAILAKHYGVPFYVLGPTSTIDMACPDGAHIPIEERPGEEIGEKWYGEKMAPEGIGYFNPAFDVTDHSLITAIVTEKGICYPPFTQSIAELFREEEK